MPRPDPRSNTGGIDISTVGRTGGVPTHVVSPTPSSATGSVPQLIQTRTGKPATFDPFAIVGRVRKAIGRRLTK